VDAALLFDAGDGATRTIALKSRKPVMRDGLHLGCGGDFKNLPSRNSWRKNVPRKSPLLLTTWSVQYSSIEVGS